VAAVVVVVVVVVAAEVVAAVAKLRFAVLNVDAAGVTRRRLYFIGRDGDSNPSERDDFSSNRHPALSSRFEHDLLGKPASTFPDHALAANSATRKAAQK
jgi:hypothetical protein